MRAAAPRAVPGPGPGLRQGTAGPDRALPAAAGCSTSSLFHEARQRAVCLTNSRWIAPAEFDYRPSLPERGPLPVGVGASRTPQFARASVPP